MSGVDEDEFEVSPVVQLILRQLVEKRGESWHLIPGTENRNSRRLPDRRLCQACREQGQNSGHSRAELEKRCQGQEETLADWSHIYVSKGGEKCRKSGYLGHCHAKPLPR